MPGTVAVRKGLRVPLLVGIACTALVTVAIPAAGASDASTIKPLVITRADVGGPYTAAKATPTNDKTFLQLAKCVGATLKGRKVTARLDGPDLSDPDTGNAVRSNASTVKTAAMARADLAVLRSPQFPGCVSSVAKTSLAAQGVTDVQSQDMTIPKYGDGSRAVATRVTGTAQGTPFVITVVQVGIVKGRAEVSASFLTQTDQPFDQATGLAILAKLGHRIQKAKT